MWMDSEFASWEVEGEVRERVNRALSEAEQGRFLRAAREARAGRTLWDRLTWITSSMRSRNVVARSRQAHEPVS